MGWLVGPFLGVKKSVGTRSFSEAPTNGVSLDVLMCLENKTPGLGGLLLERCDKIDRNMSLRIL